MLTAWETDARRYGVSASQLIYGGDGIPNKSLNLHSVGSSLLKKKLKKMLHLRLQGILVFGFLSVQLVKSPPSNAILTK